MFSSATQPPPCHPPRHNFVVSAITFEGFKLRSSNLTHASLIQISRTSSIIDILSNKFFKKLRIDLKNGQKCDRKLFADIIESEFRTSKMAAEKKICIDRKWLELRSKVNFGIPKWPIDLK